MGLVGGLCATAVLAPPALAAPVRVGWAPALPARASAAGPVSGSERLHVTVTLSPRDPSGLAAFATAVSTPGSPVFHQYLTVAQFAQRYGPGVAQIAAVRSALRAQGLDPGAVSANGLSIGVSATAAQLERAFSTSLERVALPGGRIAFANTAAPGLPAGAAPYVQSVMGLNDLAVPHRVSLERTASTGVGQLATPQVATGGPQPCSTAQSAASAQPISYTADQIAEAYSFSSLYGAGDFGAGQTVALFELEGNFPSDVTAFQSCYGTNASVSYPPLVDGGPPPPNAQKGDGAETALDIDNVIGLAKQANILVYQGPDTETGSYDTFNAIISQDRAQVISASWGLCEQYAGQPAAEAENTLFKEAAVQGESVFASAGDSGSSDCYNTPGTAGNGPSPAVDDPASQPYVTGVGGTTLYAPGPPPSETAWNGGCAGPCGGGGGVSTIWPMPKYQSQAPASLHVSDPQPVGTNCGAPSGTYCREVPDVSADGDPSTGYLIYYDGNGSATDSSAWIGYGGTSGATPLWAALIALANASKACASTPVGFVNPALYAVAGGGVTGASYATTFYDITSGETDILNANNGDFAAGAGYDMATGLGTPDGATLPAALCQAAANGTTTVTTTTTTTTTTPTTPTTPTPPPKPAAKLTVSNPGAQTTTVGTPVHLQIAVKASDGGSVTYYSAGLPPGLFINPSTGTVFGTPTQPGHSAVAIAAADSGGGSGGTSFQWNVGGLPSAGSAAVSGVASRRGTMSFNLSAGTDAPAITSLQIALPSGLSFGSVARGIVLTGSGGARLTFTATVSHGVLTLTLAAPAYGVRVRIASPALRVSRGLALRARRRRAGTLRVVLTATDAGRQTTALMLRLRP